MGSCCDHCLKKQAHEEQLVPLYHSDSQISQVRETKYLNTSFFSKNTTFYVTTQPLDKLRAQYLVMLTDSLSSVLRNQFIKELSSSTFAYLKSRIESVEKVVPFSNPGDYANIFDPFPDLRINNLLIGRMDLCENDEDSRRLLQPSINKIFDQIFENGDKFTLAIFEISSHLGYSITLFQKAFLKNILKIAKDRKQVKITYLTTNKVRQQKFMDEILAFGQENSQVTVKHTSQSNYY